MTQNYASGTFAVAAASSGSQGPAGAAGPPVIATGGIRRHGLVQTLEHLHRGRYRLTLRELRNHRRPLVIGHTTLTVS